MSLNFELRRKNHAIGEFHASLTLFQPVGAGTFAKVSDSLRRLAQKHDLPAPVPVQVFQFMIGPEGAGVPTSGPAGNSLGFQRFSKDGEVAESISCDPNSITYVLRDYSVWEEVSPKLVEIFSEITAEYIREVPAIQSIALQYLNEFRSAVSPSQNAAELFREGSKWIAPLAFEGSEAWHSHVGIYIPHDANERRLVNVNCDIAPANLPGTNEVRTLAKVLLLSGCFFNVPGGKPLIVPAQQLKEVIADKLNQAHRLEKDILRELVTDPYLQAIGANDAD